MPVHTNKSIHIYLHTRTKSEYFMIIKGKLYDVEIADVKEKTMNVRWDTRGSDILFYCRWIKYTTKQILIFIKTTCIYKKKIFL